MSLSDRKIIRRNARWLLRLTAFSDNALTRIVTGHVSRMQ
jgi:hypothetical protein